MITVKLYISGFFSTRQHSIASLRSAHYMQCNRPSICLPVTRVNHTKKVEVKIRKFLPYDNAVSLVFAW